MKRLSVYLLLLGALVSVSCNSGGYESKHSVLVVCQGSGLGKGSITQYNTQTKVIEKDFYQKANNGLDLGSLPMSLTVSANMCWVPVTGSVIVFDPMNGKYITRIASLNDPSYVSYYNQLYYISDTFKPMIVSYHMEMKKFIDTIHFSSAPNRIIGLDGYMYTNLWSYGKQIMKIDPRQNYKIVDSVDVGIQPNTLLVDQLRDFWTITDGGYPGNPLGDVAPEIIKISTLNDKMQVVKRFPLVDGPNYQLFMSALGSKLFYIAGERVFTMPFNATSLPTTAVIEVAGANFSSLAEDPFTGDIYVADAGDWVNDGKVYRYSKDYQLLDSFTTGPNPIAFCFIQ